MQTRSLRNRIEQRTQIITERLGFENNIREICQTHSNPNIVVIIENRGPNSQYTRVVIMDLTRPDYFYDLYCLDFPETLDGSIISINEDNNFVIDNTMIHMYYTLDNIQYAA